MYFCEVKAHKPVRKQIEEVNNCCQAVVGEDNIHAAGHRKTATAASKGSAQQSPHILFTALREHRSVQHPIQPYWNN